MTPELLPTTGIEENAIRRAEEFTAKATALTPAIRLEELSVFTYTKKKVIRATGIGKQNGEAPMEK